MNLLMSQNIKHQWLKRDASSPATGGRQNVMILKPDFIISESRSAHSKSGWKPHPSQPRPTLLSNSPFRPVLREFSLHRDREATHSTKRNHFSAGAPFSNDGPFSCSEIIHLHFLLALPTASFRIECNFNLRWS